MTIGHLCINAPPAKLAETVEFYKKALAPLGYAESHNYGVAVGFGDAPDRNDFWIFSKETFKGGDGADMHFAFKVDDKKKVAAGHAAALQAGAKCNGPPGPRPMYGPKYYGAFFFDPMGNNVEVVSMDADQE